MKLITDFGMLLGSDTGKGSGGGSDNAVIIGVAVAVPLAVLLVVLVIAVMLAVRDADLPKCRISSSEIQVHHTRALAMARRKTFLLLLFWIAPRMKCMVSL